MIMSIKIKSLYDNHITQLIQVFTLRTYFHVIITL